MSARSSLRSVALATLLVGCGSKAASAPEADPAKVKALAKLMIENTPAPAAVPNCTVAQLGATMLTARTLIQLAENEMPTRAERAEWSNPPELDDPSARVLVDASADATAKRQAAAKLLGGTGFIVWRPETIDVPLALGFKELKRGAFGLRALGYDRAGTSVCVTVFNIKNDKAVSEWAMDQSDKAEVDPAISKALQQDLKKILIAKVASMRAGEAP